MTTLAVVRKGAQVAIGADSLVTVGDTELMNGRETNAKLFKVGGSYLGMAGTTAHFPVLRKTLAAPPPDELKLQSRDEVYGELFEFERFRALGSGRSIALGATYVGYDKRRSAREVTMLGLAAGNEFDKNQAAPVRLYTIKSKR